MKDSGKLWGGRFNGQADQKFLDFNRSFGFDRKLLEFDVRASIAHCRALAKAGVLTDAEAASIAAGLQTIIDKAAENGGYFDELPSEDVHSFVEVRLVEMIGDTGRKLHAGRSRNDQVATDLRLWLRDEIDQISQLLRKTQWALVDLAINHREAVLPGYTHLQPAQPILWAHWCLAYFEMLSRDRQRLKEMRPRVNVLPLGSAALAGTSYRIDRNAVARELGFDSISRNSLDAVADRDFCIEFAGAASIIMLHLSRLAEDIIIYSTAEFGLVELSDAVATGSSIMPQKKNADSMELVRGKSGRVFGHLSGLLATLKGLPLAYNKDLQEDKEAVFDTADTVRGSLEVTEIVLRNIRLREEPAREAASSGYMNATELVDYLVRKGQPFRRAHEAAGKMVLLAIDAGVELQELGLDEMKSISPLIEQDVFEALSLERTLATKSQEGGTAPERVAQALDEARRSLSEEF